MTGIVCDRLAKLGGAFEPPTPCAVIDERDAARIEHAWRILGDQRVKVITRAHYVIRADWRDVARHLRFPFRSWDSELSRAGRALLHRVRE